MHRPTAPRDSRPARQKALAITVLVASFGGLGALSQDWTRLSSEQWLLAIGGFASVAAAIGLACRLWRVRRGRRVAAWAPLVIVLAGLLTGHAAIHAGLWPASPAARMILDLVSTALMDVLGLGWVIQAWFDARISEPPTS